MERSRFGMMYLGVAVRAKPFFCDRSEVAGDKIDVDTGVEDCLELSCCGEGLGHGQILGVHDLEGVNSDGGAPARIGFCVLLKGVGIGEELNEGGVNNGIDGAGYSLDHLIHFLLVFLISGQCLGIKIYNEIAGLDSTGVYAEFCNSLLAQIGEYLQLIHTFNDSSESQTVVGAGAEEHLDLVVSIEKNSDLFVKK